MTNPTPQPDEPAHAVAREMADGTHDPKRKVRWLRLADALEAATRSGDAALIQAELDRAGLHIDVLTLIRDVRDDRTHTGQRFQALYERNQEQDRVLVEVAAAITRLRGEVMQLRGELVGQRQMSGPDTLQHRDHIAHVVDEHRARTLQLFEGIEVRLAEVEERVIEARNERARILRELADIRQQLAVGGEP